MIATIGECFALMLMAGGMTGIIFLICHCYETRETKPQEESDSLERIKYLNHAQYAERYELEQRAVFDRFPIGTEFYYIGTRMKVDKHIYHWQGIDAGNYSLEGRPPQLRACYRAEDGKFYHQYFSGQEFTAIAKGKPVLQEITP